MHFTEYGIPQRSIALLLMLVGGSACQEGSAAPRQDRIPTPPPTVTVCAAAKATPGAIVRVLGEFDGFAYDTDSLHVTIATSELCSDRGAGALFVELVGKAEREKLLSRRPRGKRDNRPGDPTEVQGIVSKVGDGRFTYLVDAVVIR
jgi:hypothetical protein